MMLSSALIWIAVIIIGSLFICVLLQTFSNYDN